jgi:endogenous inhibitor of DNA gyrase (YacG/DUF329 family)
MVDLGRWLGGNYRITTRMSEEDLAEIEEDANSPKPAVPSADSP